MVFQRSLQEERLFLFEEFGLHEKITRELSQKDLR